MLSGFAAAAVMVDERGRILLVRHSYGELNWEIPGGSGETGASAADAAVREVREETGLVVAAERMTGVYFGPAAKCHHFVFACRRTMLTEPRPTSPEITEVRWCERIALPRPIGDFTLRRSGSGLAAQRQLVAAGRLHDGVSQVRVERHQRRVLAHRARVDLAVALRARTRGA